MLRVIEKKPTVSWFSKIQTATKNIPIMKVLYSENAFITNMQHTLDVSLYDITYGDFVGKLSKTCLMELSYGFKLEKQKHPLFREYTLKNKYITCVEYPNESYNIQDNGKLGYSCGSKEKVVAYQVKTDKIGTVSYFGTNIIMYGYIPIGTKYIKIKPFGKFDYGVPQYAAETIIIYPFDIQKQFTPLTGYKQVLKLTNNN